jgi:hypothetical protein
LAHQGLQQQQPYEQSLLAIQHFVLQKQRLSLLEKDLQLASSWNSVELAD